MSSVEFQPNAAIVNDGGGGVAHNSVNCSGRTLAVGLTLTAVAVVSLITAIALSILAVFTLNPVVLPVGMLFFLISFTSSIGLICLGMAMKKTEHVSQKKLSTNTATSISKTSKPNQSIPTPKSITTPIPKLIITTAPTPVAKKIVTVPTIQPSHTNTSTSQPTSSERKSPECRFCPSPSKEELLGEALGNATNEIVSTLFNPGSRRPPSNPVAETLDHIIKEIKKPSSGGLQEISNFMREGRGQTFSSRVACDLQGAINHVKNHNQRSPLDVFVGKILK